ncbi:MAG TPA: preprotein translocase subunit SecA [Oculatellaceae cyanobacterium]
MVREKLIKLLFGDTNEKRLKFLRDYVNRANSLEPEIQKLTDDELKGKTGEFKRLIDNALSAAPNVKLLADDVPKMPGQIRFSHDKILGDVLDSILPEAFAVVRETGRRILNMRHFDVQFIGGAALHFNKIAEMRTGEGKTLVATLPAYLNALSGRGVHVVTVNDYLARRDCEWMGQIYRFLGLTTGLVYSHQPDAEKWNAYRADIAYGTNHEFGFDYLRDNMRTSLNELVQRPYYFSIVDEVDNILIDEARTPLIISGFPTESFTDIYHSMTRIAPLLEKGKDKDDEECDYWVDEKGRNVLLTERGILNGERLLNQGDLFDVHYNYAHHLVQALRAKELYKKDTDYVIRENEQGKPEIVIVDEFTGRMMVGRRWSDGLHQAIEAKENVPIQEETLTLASITYQNLFRLYPKLGGMTGTAMTEAAEFQKIYNLDVVAIPTNRPTVRVDQPDVIYKTEQQKFFSVVEEIVEVHQTGRPVLVGTASIEKSEVIDEILGKPQHMNQYLLKKINKCIETMKRLKIDTDPALEGLRKIFERPGMIDEKQLETVITDAESTFRKKEEFLDQLLSILRTVKVVNAIRKGIDHSILNAKYHEKEALIVAQAGRKGAVTVATNMAGRGTDILLGGNAEMLAKEQLLRKGVGTDDETYEEQLKELTKEVKKDTDVAHDEVVKLGGLHIIGTERHEARRIDNQLRGRAARQGDPGTTRFFLSLEDTLMRIFGGDKIAGLMNLIGAEEDMPIESGMVTKSIEGAQRKVEAHHFDMRKNVLQYDDVLNTQREVIYRERRRILERADLKNNMLDMLEEHLDIILGTHIDPESPPESWEETELPTVLQTLQNDIPMFAELSVSEVKGRSYDDLRHRLLEAVRLAYEVREEHIGSDTMRELERQILLRTIDSKWVDYLHNIDLLREGIHLRGYGQRDPLQEYKREAFEMFNALLRNIQQESIQLLFHAQPQMMPMDIDPDELERMMQQGMQLHFADENGLPVTEGDNLTGNGQGAVPPGSITASISEGTGNGGNGNVSDILKNLGQIDNIYKGPTPSSPDQASTDTNGVTNTPGEKADASVDKAGQDK